MYRAEEVETPSQRLRRDREGWSMTFFQWGHALVELAGVLFLIGGLVLAVSYWLGV